MTGTELILKINSYQNKNIVLKDNCILFEYNSIQNYMDTPITECAIELFQNILNEFNTNHFNLKVFANSFEQELIKLCFNNKNLSETAQLELLKPAISLSTEQRLSYICDFAKNENIAIENQEVDINIVSENHTINLSSYPLVNMNYSQKAPCIYIEKSLFALERKLDESNSTNVGFCIGAESQLLDNNKYVIGCTEENVNALVKAYIETQYINPIVNKLIQEFKLYEKNMVFAAFSCTDTYYYRDNIQQRLNTFVGDKINTGIHSLYIDENCKLLKDRTCDLEKLVIQATEFSYADTHEATRYLNTSYDDGLCVEGKREALLITKYYFDSYKPITEIILDIKEHRYVNNIRLNVDVNKWRLEHEYKINVEAFPVDAEDIDEIVLSSSNPEVAEVYGNTLRIKGDGKFKLIARAKTFFTEKHFDIDTYKILSIEASDWPEDNKAIAGNEISTSVLINGSTASSNEYICEIASGEDIVTVKNRSNTIVVKCKKKGKAQIKIFSSEDVSKFCVLDLDVKRNPREKRDWFFFKAAFVLLIAATVLMFLRASLTLPCLVLSTIALLFGSLRNEKHWFIVLPIIIALVGTIGYFRTTVYYDINRPLNLSELNDAMFEELQKDSQPLVLESPFEDAYTSTFFNEFTYIPSSVEYIGATLIPDEKLIFKDENELLLAYKVNATCPDNNSSIERYTIVTYNNIEITAKNELIYSEKSGSSSIHFSYYETFNDLWEKTDINRGQTNIPQDFLYNQFGFDNLVNSPSQISLNQLQDEVDDLIESTNISNTSKTNKGLSFSDVKFYKAMIYTPKSNYEQITTNNPPNLLFIVLSQDMYQDGEKTGEYYHIYYFTYVSLDSNNNLVLPGNTLEKTKNLDEYLDNVWDKHFDFPSQDEFNSAYQLSYIE